MRVLFTFAAPTPGSNPYTEQLAKSMPPGVDWRYWGWGTALLWRYDVVHLHWPEYLMRQRSPAQAVIKRLLVLALLTRWKLRRVAVVETIHNERPHESGSQTEMRLSALVSRSANGWIKLNPATADRKPYTAYIPLGHYRDWFTARAESAIPGRMLFFGLVRPYKGVESLINSFSDVSDAASTLRVVGKPHDDATRDRILSLAEPDHRVTVILRHLDDDELSREILEAEAVVLPYQNMHNSSAAIAALSLNRPIVVSNSAAMNALREEVGRAWVYLLQGSLDANAIRAAKTWLANTSSERTTSSPDLSRRGWAEAGLAHVAAYEQAIKIARAHGSTGARNCK